MTGSLPFEKNQPPGRGYETRVEGYFGAPQDTAGQAVTQPFQPVDHSEPLTRDQDNRKVAATLKLPPLTDQSPQSYQETGDVGFTWADAPGGARPNELLHEQEEGEQLEQREAQLQEGLEALAAKIEGVSRERTDYIQVTGGERLAEDREYVMQSITAGGTWMQMILWDQEQLKRLDLREMDVAACMLKEQWGHGWRFCKKAETSAVMSVRETALVMSDTSRLLNSLYPELAQSVGKEDLEEIMGRHRLLASGLSGATVSPQASMLFPKEDAQAILDWYARLRTGLEELDRLKLILKNAAGDVGKLLEQYPGPKPKPPLITTRSVRGGSLKGSEESAGLESYRSDFRDQAKAAGKGYRMGGVGSPGLEADEASQGFGEPSDLPSHLIKSRGRARVMEEEAQRERSGGSVQSKISEYDEDSGISGFDRESMETILQELHMYVCDALSELGKDTPVTEAIIMDCIPMMNLWTKNQSSTTKDFARAVKDIKPRTSDDYISVREWWKAINLLADDYGWSLRMRVTFMRRTGGLAAKHNDEIAQRMKNLMEHMSDWIRSADAFEPSRPESDQRYWLYAWTDVGLKMISEFHQIQQADEIERQLGELMEEEAYQIKADVDDPLNSQFHKVQALYKAMNNWLRDRSSALVESPLYVWKLLVEWMKASRPMGPLMLTHIQKALNKLGTNVEEALPRGHGRSKAQLEAIRKKGSMGATEATYGLILERLKLMAVNKELTMEVKTFSEMRDISKTRPRAMVTAAVAVLPRRGGRGRGRLGR